MAYIKFKELTKYFDFKDETNPFELPDYTKEYVEKVSQNIILINGTMLAQLMIEYNVGVQVNYSYEIKKIDNDYFEMI